MTITLNPEQEQAVRAAIRSGQVASVEELIDRAIAGLRRQRKAEAPASGRQIAEQGLGLFVEEQLNVMLRALGEKPHESTHTRT
jgi:hypothetical protein